MDDLRGVLLVIFAALGYLIGRPKGRPTAGALLGLFLGPIGLIVAVMLSEKDAP